MDLSTMAPDLGSREICQREKSNFREIFPPSRWKTRKLLSFFLHTKHENVLAHSLHMLSENTCSTARLVENRRPAFSTAAFVINFSPRILINFPSELMKTRIIQRVCVRRRREISPGVCCKSSQGVDESFNLSHTLAAHTRRHSPQFSGTTGKRMKKIERAR